MLSDLMKAELSNFRFGFVILSVIILCFVGASGLFSTELGL